MVKKPNAYEPIDAELSPAHALVQSATVLDYAAINAIKANDFDRMMVVARGWAELSQVIGNVAESANEEVELTSETEVLGFRSEEEREEYEDRARRRRDSR
jgi:hypothetical protein